MRFFPLGWVLYGNHVYRPFTEKKTWDRAKVNCESTGAYLVEIESFKENENIRAIIHQKFNSEKGKMMVTVELETYIHFLRGNKLIQCTQFYVYTNDIKNG